MNARDKTLSLQRILAARGISVDFATARLHFYHQTDPRGAALYVSNEPLTDQNYSSSGVCCAV